MLTKDMYAVNLSVGNREQATSSETCAFRGSSAASPVAMVSPPPPRPVHPFFQLSSAQSKRKGQAGLAAGDSTRKGHNTPISTGQGSKDDTPFRGFKVGYQGNGKQDADETLDSTDDGRSDN